MVREDKRAWYGWIGVRWDRILELLEGTLMVGVL